MWAQRMEAHRVQKKVLHIISDAKEFDLVKRDKQKHDNIRQ